MTINEYAKELSKIRYLINNLAYDMGATYDTNIFYLEQIVNDALQGDLLIESSAPIEAGDRLGSYTDVFKINNKGAQA